MASGYFRRSGVKGYRVPSTGVYLEGSGSGDAGMKIWKPVMQKYFQQIPRTGFRQPPRKIQVGKQVRVPSLIRPEHCRRDQEAGEGGLHRREASTPTATRCRKYGFIGWSPGPGSYDLASSARSTRMYSKGRDPAEVAEEKADAKKKAAARRRRRAAEQAASRRRLAALDAPRLRLAGDGHVDSQSSAG